MKILANRMDVGFFKHQKEYEMAALEVLRSGWYVLGKNVNQFEDGFARFHENALTVTNADGNTFQNDIYCATLASGLDALWIGIKLLGIGPGDEIIVQANTYIASVMGITINGATPVFVDSDDDGQINVEQIEGAITSATKAVMVVHLYGQVTDMTRVVEICKKYHLRLIEDCAQAHGAMWNGQKVGTFGDIGCFSFYPTKNIGAFGDAGAIISHDKNLIEEVKVFRNYGSEKKYYNKMVGANSRLDEIQAALLQIRLKYYDEITTGRRQIAKRYIEGIKNTNIRLPREKQNSYAVWHQFVIRCKWRDQLKEYLEKNEIGSIIHYPIPPYKQKAYQYLKVDANNYPMANQLAEEVLSIPIYDGMTEEEQKYVMDVINRFDG